MSISTVHEYEFTHQKQTLTVPVRRVSRVQQAVRESKNVYTSPLLYVNNLQSLLWAWVGVW